jgi:glycosyltransferase involved in cell wall biosynthesis
MDIHLDLSELVGNPLRSGIQRIEREAIRHWSGPARLIPCFVDAQGGLRRLSPKTLEVLCSPDDGTPSSRSEEHETLRRLASASDAEPDSAVERILNLELFFDPARADTYLRLAAAGVPVLWYVYDFIPFLRPELFPPGTTVQCMHYLRGLLGIGRRVAFISESSRSDYIRRIAHLKDPCDNPVITPGADGLGLEPQTFSPDRRLFVAIGTVEPRKNPGAMLRAFNQLWDEGVTVPLVVAGRISPDAEEALAFFARHASHPYLTVLDQPTDETLRQVLRTARALVMPSEVEGFGLPPFEALHAGIPSIASAALPSAALLQGGVVLLERMDQSSIANAVRTMLDDKEAARSWHNASSVRLPTLAEFGQTLAAWAHGA